MTHKFTCDICYKEKTHNDAHTTGYGTRKNKQGTEIKVCFDCCGMLDNADMAMTGKAILYLSNSKVTNWPNTLSYPVMTSKHSKHAAFGGYIDRTDVWFLYADGYIWHGVNIGDNDLLRCKRTKVFWMARFGAIKNKRRDFHTFLWNSKTDDYDIQKSDPPNSVLASLYDRKYSQEYENLSEDELTAIEDAIKICIRQQELF